MAIWHKESDVIHGSEKQTFACWELEAVPEDPVLIIWVFQLFLHTDKAAFGLKTNVSEISVPFGTIPLM